MTVTFSALCAGYLADFASHLQQEVIVSWAPLVRESMSKVDAAPDELRLAGREFGRERDSEHRAVGLCIDRWFPTRGLLVDSRSGSAGNRAKTLSATAAKRSVAQLLTGGLLYSSRSPLTESSVWFWSMEGSSTEVGKRRDCPDDFAQVWSASCHDPPRVEAEITRSL